jgi:hypothetical protein
MKVKKFKNLWTMGLILFGAILILFYVAKIFFPEFIVGVAEIPSIVAFGNFVDSHWWSYYLFTFITSFIGSYLFNCACLSKTKLNWLELLILTCSIIVMFLFETVSIHYYQVISVLIMLLTPTILSLLNKKQNISTFYMTTFCLIVHTFAQILSAEIRGIASMISYPNSATFFILLIDAYIWLFLMYCFSNYKKES